MQLYTTPLFCEYIKLPMSEEEKNKPRPSFSLSNQFRSLFCRALRRTHQEETQSKKFTRGLEKHMIAAASRSIQSIRLYRILEGNASQEKP